MGAVVVAHDPSWASAFAAERTALESTLGQLLTGRVEHIGSTSIPGMPAKPILDMMAPVAALSDAEAAIEPLSGLGYAVRPHRIDALRFVKPDTDVTAETTHHLHLTEVTSQLWRERLLFRDAVRADPALLTQYAALKARLLEETGGRVYSAVGKREFVRAVLARAGHELRDGMHTR